MRGLLLHVMVFALAPGMTYAAAPKNFKELADILAVMMNWAISLLITAGIVIYFWGAVKRIYEHGEGSDSWEMRKFLLMGLAIIFVMVSVWGIVALLQNSLGWGSGGFSV